MRWHNIVAQDPQSIYHVMQKYLACEPLMLSDLSVYFEVHLRNHKGWQWKVDKRQDKSDLQGELYFHRNQHPDNT